MTVNTFRIIRNILTLMVLFFIIDATNAQEENFWSKVNFGGNIGFGFNNNGFSASIEPAAKYNFSPKFAAGVGLSFGYLNADSFKSTNYGGRIFSMYSPIPQLFLSAELQEMGVSRTTEVASAPDLKNNFWYPSLFLGAGYRMGNLHAGFRYDVLHNKNKGLFSSPISPYIGVFF